MPVFVTHAVGSWAALYSGLRHRAHARLVRPCRRAGRWRRCGNCGRSRHAQGDETRATRHARPDRRHPQHAPHRHRRPRRGVIASGVLLFAADVVDLRAVEVVLAQDADGRGADDQRRGARARRARCSANAGREAHGRPCAGRPAQPGALVADDAGRRGASQHLTLMKTIHGRLLAARVRATVGCFAGGARGAGHPGATCLPRR